MSLTFFTCFFSSDGGAQEPRETFGGRLPRAIHARLKVMWGTYGEATGLRPPACTGSVPCLTIETCEDRQHDKCKKWIELCKKRC